MRNIKLVLEYDGTNYHGWQTQPNMPTIQDTIEEALAKLTKTPIQIIGAGRTDTGVHAEGQVANFQTDSRIPVVAFQKGLNALLPPDIVVCSATEVPVEFHARFSATRRRYRYTILNREYPSALMRQTSYRFATEIDISRTNNVCQTLVGKHDFSSFQKVGSDRINPICEIYEAYWWTKAPYVYFEIEADAFLRGMVRAITGTLLKYTKCRDAEMELRRILDAKDRAAAGMSAPAHGLSLIEVKYNA
ncbi:tRNA pseudouridine(38-40) synthase TruA [Candidatus Poribacteria bacterium]|nr:tRNA pseudouridine(38-40) synthase TruA [Candidatus Poribacteria bacterium]